LENGPGGGEVGRRDPPMALALPGREERFEDLVDEAALPLRVHYLLVLALFVQAHDVLREILERARQVRLDCADGKRARRLGAGGAVISRQDAAAARGPERGPFACIGVERAELHRFDRLRRFRHHLEARALHLFYQDGWLDKRLVIEPERRYDEVAGSGPEEIDEGRCGRAATIALGRPAECRQDAR